MCGIAAVFAYSPRDRAAQREQIGRMCVGRMCDRMSCRGPDGDGIWVGADGRIALGHRRLAIIDLSDRGTQPMQDASGMHVVAFNGEIYNFRQIRAELEAKGYRFSSDSDTEVLLHLYADKGEAMVHDLRGMFAFALWDEKKQGLFLARDPFGIKPLYYADAGGCFRAASEVKALLAGGEVDTQPEPAGHVGFLLWGHVPEPYTLYKGIRALPAGSTLWVGQEGPSSVRKYADVTQLLSQAESDAAPVDADAVDTLRAALLDTVRHHLIADVEVGVFLSAGLDSTTLAALAAEVGGRLRTVTLGFERYRGTEQDETPLAEAVARQYGAKHQTVWISRKDFQQELGHLLDRMDQPTIDGVNSYFVARATAGTGLKVALSGVGGDELFGGYPSFRDVPRLVGAVGRVPFAKAFGGGFRAVSAPILKRFTSPKYAGLLEYGGGYGGAYMLRRGLYMPWELPELLDGELVRDGWRELQTMARLESTVGGIGTDSFKVSALEAAWYMRNQLLRDTDWASMTHSLEVRVPFVDWTLWKQVIPLYRSTAPPSKRAMASTPRVPLPAGVLSRAKTGFTIPTTQWVGDERDGRYAQRGLRGWARRVYEAAQ